MLTCRPRLHEVHIVTAEFAVDLNSGSALGKAYHPLLVTSNRCIPVKSTVDRSAVVFCACKIIRLFSVVFYVLR